MKRNVIIKIFLDITMTVLYALLMFAQGLGGFFHETVGIGIGLLFTIHIVLNFQMIKGLFISLKKGKLNVKKGILLVSDLMLTLCMPVVIVTGILIAKELFVVDSGISWLLLFNLHNILSYVCLSIMILHILMHTKYLLGVIKKLSSSFRGKEMKSAICRFSAGAFVAVILYSSLAVFTTASNNQDAIKGNNTIKNEDRETTVPKNSIPVYSETTVSVESSEPETEPKVNIEEVTEAVVEEETEQINAVEEETAASPSLEEYLSGLFCTGCGRACPLISPRCGKGELQAEDAEKEYYRTYFG